MNRKSLSPLQSGAILALALLALFNLPSQAQTADGVRLKLGPVILAEVASGAGSAVGEVAVEHLQTEGPIDVVFLDNGVEFVPAGPNETLGLSVSPAGIATVTSTGPWSFEVTGDVEGMTDLTVELLDNGVPQYTSPAIEVHVEEEFEADGLRIRDGITVLVEELMGVVTGEIALEHEQTTGNLDITFIDDMGGEFTPDSEFVFEFEVADPTIATLTKTGPWSFTVEGLLEGMTTMLVKVEHEGHFDYISQPLEIHVEEEFEADGLTIWHFGSPVVEQDQGVVNGRLLMLPGFTSHEHTITFFNAEAGEFTPDAEFNFEFDLGDPGIATVTKTGPWSFTFTGVSVGITTFNVKVEHEGHFDFISQNIEIKIGDPNVTSAPGSSVFSLRPPSPNPVRGASTIAFSLAEPSRVDLSVFDLRGRKVDTLVTGQLPSGRQSLTWNTSGVASGTYFLRLTASGSTAAQKVVVR